MVQSSNKEQMSIIKVSDNHLNLNDKLIKAKETLVQLLLMKILSLFLMKSSIQLLLSLSLSLPVFMSFI